MSCAQLKEVSEALGHLIRQYVLVEFNVEARLIVGLDDAFYGAADRQLKDAVELHAVLPQTCVS